MRAVKRRSDERGLTQRGWLDSKHTFSFGEYQDPAHMQFRALRVLNDDHVDAGQGFGKHGHRDAEILSYVISGQLEHQDSMGNGRTIQAGDLQYMSAGSGVMHSEYNPSDSESVHFLQIWILPDSSGGEPRYAERAMAADTKPNSLTLLASGDGRDGTIGIRAEAEVYFGRLDAGFSTAHPVDAGRGVFVHVIKGQVEIDGLQLEPGDGASIEIEDAESVGVLAGADAEFLLFDLK
jgi:redox-sensitive bicupin YhaK (pirin superfamily)